MKGIVVRLTMVCVSLMVICLVFTAQSFAEIAPQTIAGLWLFDESTGNVAKDSSDNGNDGKLMNGPKRVEGKFGKALEFDNEGACVDCGNDKSLDVNSFTLAVWVFPTVIDASTHEMIGGKGWSGTERSYYLSILEEKAFLSFRDSGNTAQADVKGNTSLEKSTWYHIAGTHDRKAKKAAIYVNGVKEAEKAIDYDVMITPKTVLIGNLGDQELFFGGKIDEFAIFNVALNETDIKNIMKGFQSILAVSLTGKLATTWSAIKSP